MVFYTYQGIRFRGSKFYYNPYHSIRDRYGDLQEMLNVGFFKKSRFMSAAKETRPANWFYDDARTLPNIIFGEDVIQDHWNQRFANKNSHVFSFIARDKKFYTHPRDAWINEQVSLMKEHRCGYGEGFQHMERAYQKKLYVSQLERQHQLQRVQELGGCTELSERTWMDSHLHNEAENRSRVQKELKNRLFRNDLRELIETRAKACENNDLEFQRISIVDFHPATIDQEKVQKYIRENEEEACYFDMSWFVLDKDMMFQLHSFNRAAFQELMGQMREAEVRWDRVNDFALEYWDKLGTALNEEDLENSQKRIIPGHPNKFPRFLWEEETRKMRKKDKEFADLLSSTGNKDAQKWYASRQQKDKQARSSLDSLIANMDLIIEQNELLEKEGSEEVDQNALEKESEEVPGIESHEKQI